MHICAHNWACRSVVLDSIASRSAREGRSTERNVGFMAHKEPWRARLLAALTEVVERRRHPDYVWPGRAERIGGGGDLLEPDANRHVDTLLHEDPVFLELMTYPAVMDYVHGLFNPDGAPSPSVCSSDA